MIDINKEAEELADEVVFKDNTHLYASYFQGVIAGYNSKATQAKILQTLIEENKTILSMLRKHGNAQNRLFVTGRITELEEQLKELENDSR
jgi:hypothetical protein